MTYCQCPDCDRLKFRNVETNKTMWLGLNPQEKNALDIIIMSQLLLVLVDGLNLYPETCPDCKAAKLN